MNSELNRGQSLVEILLAFGLMFVLLPALLTGFVASREGKAQQNQRVFALPLLTEAQEAVRSIREKGWTAFAVNGTYHPIISGSAWSLSSGTETINGLVRSVVISNANRDAAGAIVTSGGTPDPSTKKVVITISWSTPYSSSLSSTVYLTRHENARYRETTQGEFNAGVVSGTQVTNIAGGEVQLGASGRGDWCQPHLDENDGGIQSVNLPKSGVANAVSAIQGKVFSGTGENASGVSYATVNITNPAYPALPAGSIDGTFDNFKTNGIFGESNYAYITTDTNNKQGVIIDLTNQVAGKYVELGTLNLQSSSTNGQSIVVSTINGITYAYMSGSNGKLYVFNITTRSGAHNSIANVTLAGTAKKIVISGNYIYAAIDSTTTQFQIIPLQNNGASFGTPASLHVDGQAGVDVVVNDAATRAYLATAQSATQKEMFIINTSNKANPLTISNGSYESNGMNPKGIAVVTNNKAILVGTGGYEYQVFDVNNDTPTDCITGTGKLNVDTGINGIAWVLETPLATDGDAYSYIITGDASSELKIIAGGSGANYSSTGTFTSQPITIPAGEAALNNFSATIATPPSTAISVQIAGANQVSGSCTGASYMFMDLVNPVISGSTLTGIIPTDDDEVGYENPARCLKYKATLSSSDTTQTPVLYDATINYSP